MGCHASALTNKIQTGYLSHDISFDPDKDIYCWRVFFENNNNVDELIDEQIHDNIKSSASEFFKGFSQQKSERVYFSVLPINQDFPSDRKPYFIAAVNLLEKTLEDMGHLEVASKEAA